MLLSPTPVFSAEVESTATSVPTVMETLAPTATAANDAVCNCAATCTQDQMDVSCPICGAQNAVAEQCAFVAPTAVPVEAPQAEPVLLSATGEGDVLPFTQDTVSVENVTYTGSALAPVLKAGGKTLTAGTDYRITSTTPAGDAINAGSYTYTFEGMGSYEGSFTAEWKILRKEITESMISVGTLLYTGNAQDAPITVKDGDKTLVKDTDYQLTIFTSGYSAQSYTSNVTGKGNYTGKIENIEWEIQPKKITEDMIVTRVYNGQEQLAALKDGDTMLERDKDYAVYGTVGVTNVGSYDVNFHGKGNYTGTLVHAR